LRLTLAKAFIVACSCATATTAFADVYVNQMDGAPSNMPRQGNGPAYIQQLPPSARPRPQPNRPNAAVGKNRPRELAAARKPAFPDVGAGVSLALAPSKTDSELPNVGRGVVKR